MWPNRQIRVLVPYAAGGSADNAARSNTEQQLADDLAFFGVLLKQLDIRLDQ